MIFDDADDRSVKERFEAEAYQRLGVPAGEFGSMDPAIRNRLITRFYAREYAGDPDDLKWAGMAAYGSQTVGEAIMESRLIDDVPVARALLGAPRGEALEDALARGNGGLFQQIGWQHAAFDEGGIEALQDAFIEGDLPLEQLQSWQQIADARALREKGDPDSLRRAEDMTWAGNEGLLRYEQMTFLQGQVYQGNEAMFDWLSRSAPLRSPIPGGRSFQESAGADKNLADPNARWSWVGGDMMDDWKARDRDRQAVLDDLAALGKVPLPEGGAPDWYPQD